MHVWSSAYASLSVKKNKVQRWRLWVFFLCLLFKSVVFSVYLFLIYLLMKTFFSHRGSLLTRNLGDLVKKEDFVLDSEYLTTQLVVVPRYNCTCMSLALKIKQVFLFSFLCNLHCIQCMWTILIHCETDLQVVCSFLSDKNVRQY